MSDYIKREDATAVISKTLGSLGNSVITEINSLSGYVADRPTGRWVRKEKEINDCDGHRAYYWYECDNCGARPPKDQWGHEWHSDFCPNCGSRNIEGDQE